MIKYFPIIFICVILLNFLEGQNKTEKNKYMSLGFLDHKTGISLVGYARTLKKVDKHELFVGVGTLIALNTLSVGWKYYLSDSPVHFYSVIAAQGAVGMSVKFNILPIVFASVGFEKSIFKHIWINLGVNSTARLYLDGSHNTDFLVLPNANINWRW